MGEEAGDGGERLYEGGTGSQAATGLLQEEDYELGEELKWEQEDGV